MKCRFIVCEKIRNLSLIVAYSVLRLKCVWKGTRSLIVCVSWSFTVHAEPVVCSTDRSKAVIPLLVLLFVALWFILRGDFLYVFPCVILFLCFSVLLVLRLPRLGKRELILVLSYVCSVCACLDLSVSSSSWRLGRAAVCDCGTPWTFLLPFFISSSKTMKKDICYR